MSNENKLEKNKGDDLLLAILHVLEKEANKHKPFTKTEIENCITSDEDFKRIISVRDSLRNTISDKLENIEMFYELKQQKKLVKKGKKYYVENSLSSADIQMLIDDVMFSKMRTKEEVRRLTGLLKQNTSKEFQKKLNYLKQIPEKQYTLNPDVQKNINIIREAIQHNELNYNRSYAEKKLLEFYFNSYSTDKKLHTKTKNGKPKTYKVFPLGILEAYNNYYLVCVLEGKEEHSHYRIDLMTDMKIVISKKDTKSLVSNWSNIKNTDISKYLSEYLYMSYRVKDDSIKLTTLRIKKWNNEEITNLTFLHDHFGTNWEFEKDEEDYVYVKVKCLTYGITLFVRQYMDNVKVIEPEKVKKEVEESLKKSFANYFTLLAEEESE